MLSSPFRDRPFGPIVGQLGYAQRNLLGGIVDELLTLSVISARWQPQMPLQQLGHQPCGHQIIHTAILRSQSTSRGVAGGDRQPGHENITQWRRVTAEFRFWRYRIRPWLDQIDRAEFISAPSCHHYAYPRSSA